ncbi:DUF1330 domain-containing protein [Adhaeribacter swui]|uniref:DUF1330 domain-containing protein n=1 Tax=Adhaeribacter swui TaxID=2086471 RepID=A0A7G7GBD9_9BACT|nr:DUF1330 domain-containing protein [Adhaeribacter swui]QNF34473.1 DUF1330 domain-containing protein [Adhaeribacter swui]
METEKLYLTLLVYVRKGEEETFLKYEDQVLPLLPQYYGELVYRIRPDKSNFVHATDELPYEIHLLTFPTTQDFENFRQDPERLKHQPLFTKSVRKVLLLPGQS